MKKQIILCTIICSLIGISFLTGSVSNSFNQKLETGFDFDLISGVNVKGKYYLNAKMTTSDGLPGKSKNCEITLSNGEIYLSLDVDIIGVDQSGSIDYSLPLGEDKKVSIPGTAGLLKAKVKVTATVTNIVGDDKIQINTNTLSFNSQGKKSITYTILSNAELDDTFSISADVSLNINVEVIADYLLGEQTLASGALPISTMSPSMSATGTVKAQEDTNGGFSFDLSNPIFLLLIIIIIVVVVIAIAAVAYKKKKSKKKPPLIKKTVKPAVKKEKDEPIPKDLPVYIPAEDTFEEEMEEFEKTKDKKKTEKNKPAKKPASKQKPVPLHVEEKPAVEKPVETKKRRNFCPKCGNNLGASSKFCGKCGYKF